MVMSRHAAVAAFRGVALSRVVMLRLCCNPELSYRRASCVYAYGVFAAVCKLPML
jgi:hypothetical protein